MRPLTTISLAALLCLALLTLPVPAAEAPAAGALKVGDEVVLMADGPGRTMRSFPAVGFGRDLFLAAWQEGWHGKGGGSRIYVARVGLDGKTLDPKGIELAPCKTGVQEYTRVAFFGGVFLVVWHDMRNGKDCDVLAARVSPEGKVLDAQPISVAAGPRTQAMPDVAADDKGFMVVWHGFQGEEVFPKVFSARVGPDGSRGEPVVVTDGATPRIAWNGREHLVIYSMGRHKRWLRMDTSGKALWNPTTRSWSEGVAGDPVCSTCALSSERGWLIVYHGGEPNWWYRSMAIQRVARITPEGKKEAPGDTNGNYGPKGGVPPENWLDTSFGKETQANVGGSAHTPAVFPYGGSALAADGQYCVVVWQRYHMGGASNMEMANGDLLASRLDGWKPLDKGGVPVAASAAEEINPALAGNGAGKLLCAYEKVEDGRARIVVRTLQTQ
ncbi:MAG TPA: hypothetical protein VNE39_08755 [Planctomycetota bacterium]|nr:hypothetical protein [Planctomycetota bacterium]